MRVKRYDLLAIGDAGRELDLCASALRNWVRSGDLKCLVASDGSRLFKRKHLEDFKVRRERRRVAMARARQKVSRAVAVMVEREVNR